MSDTCIRTEQLHSERGASVLSRVYLVTPPKTTAPTTRPLQPSSQRPTMRFVAAFGTVTAAREVEAPASAVMVLWHLRTSHWRACGFCRGGFQRSEVKEEWFDHLIMIIAMLKLPFRTIGTIYKYTKKWYKITLNTKNNWPIVLKTKNNNKVDFDLWATSVFTTWSWSEIQNRSTNSVMRLESQQTQGCRWKFY